MTPTHSHSDNLFVANLNSVPLEKLVRSKLELLMKQSKEASMNNLYDLVIEQVEKPLLEIALKTHSGNQIQTAKFLGINRNTLRKKITDYKIKVAALKAQPQVVAASLSVAPVAAPTAAPVVAAAAQL